MKVIVVSHGTFAKGIVDGVQMLTGEQENLLAYCLYPKQTVDELAAQLEEELKKTPEGEEVLFLTDLFHGSPFNAVVSLMRNYKFSHITGVNIPLLITIMLERYDGKSAKEICEAALEESANSIIYVDKMLEGVNDDEEEE